MYLSKKELKLLLATVKATMCGPLIGYKGFPNWSEDLEGIETRLEIEITYLDGPPAKLSDL